MRETQYLAFLALWCLGFAILCRLGGVFNDIPTAVNAVLATVCFVVVTVKHMRKVWIDKKRWERAAIAATKFTR